MPLPDKGSGCDWRAALAAFDPAAARGPATPHAARLLISRDAEAEAALRAYLGRAPDDSQVLVAYGVLLRRLGRPVEAGEVFGRATRAEATRLALSPEDRDATVQFLSAGGGPPPAKAPAAYIAAGFDEIADQYDALLRDDLAYRGPEVLLDAVSRVAGRMLHDLDVLDLGCGTGLTGELFRRAGRRLDGVDLSPKMLARAAARGVYDRLTAGDLVAHLEGTGERYHLVVAADVFVYVGDLVPVFAAARRVLRPGGWLAFTVEAGDGADYHLQPVRRYAHPRDYLTCTAAATGFIVQCLEETVVRTESRRPVRSFVCVLAGAVRPGCE